jgi:hypothetical protein
VCCAAVPKPLDVIPICEASRESRAHHVHRQTPASTPQAVASHQQSRNCASTFVSSLADELTSAKGCPPKDRWLAGKCREAESLKAICLGFLAPHLPIIASVAGQLPAHVKSTLLYIARSVSSTARLQHIQQTLPSYAALQRSCRSKR